METSLKPEKNINESTAEAFNTKLLNEIEKNIDELVIDMIDVQEIDPVGLGLLIAAKKLMRKSDGLMMLTNVSTDIFNLFKAMRLDHYFDITVSA